MLNQCQFPDLIIHSNLVEGDWYLQISNQDWKGRKWRLSPFMTDGEVVQTAFKAVMTFVEHETREHFTFQGKAIFGPHLDIYELVKIADKPVFRKEKPEDDVHSI